MGVPVGEYENLDRDLFPIIRQFLEGLAFLHSKCVAHLDLKPSHLLVNKDGSVFIIDYDLSRRFKDTTQVWSGYQGTSGFSAPEVDEGKTYNPFLADVWSAGCVIYELCDFCGFCEVVEFLTGVAEKMMDEEPSRRPSLQDTIQEIVDYNARTPRERSNNV